MRRIFILVIFVGLFVTACDDDFHKEAIHPATSDIKQSKRDTESLDLLTNYDKDLWSGPAGWSDKQWKWKKRLRWGKGCDYVADVEIYSLSKTQQLVQVMCVPGAYQAMYYLFLYDSKSKLTTQLALGSPENTDEFNEIFGHLTFNEKHSQLSILTLSRAVGDCGVYRVFRFEETDFLPALVEKRKRECSKNIPPEELPKSFFNPEKWPLINTDKNG